MALEPGEEGARGWEPCEPRHAPGRWVEALLAQRLPARSCAVHGFQVALRLLGRSARGFPTTARLPFTAVYWRGVAGECCPYSGKVELPRGAPLPVHESGVVMLTLVNPSGHPLKLLSVKYDLRGMPEATRTCQRYTVRAAGRLAYAVHLNFARPARRGPEPGRRGHQLVGPLRVVFAPREPDPGEGVSSEYEAPVPRFYSMLVRRSFLDV